jgi:hypothetical protein
LNIPARDAAPPPAPPMRFTAEGDRRALLSGADREAMYALLCRHFEGVTRARFEQDLDEKDWALLIRHEGQLVGFTTLQAYPSRFEGRALNVLYSGDTITGPEVWGTSVLARSWIALVRRIQGARAAEPWYWLLLSSGFRTYRLLGVFFREFWPRHDAPTPPGAARLLAHLARERFGERFDAAGGLVRFAEPQRLRDALATVPGGRQQDSHVAYFLARNPGHAAGDELVCIADLAEANLSVLGRRMQRSGAP